jgi:hypothetical protein
MEKLLSLRWVFDPPIRMKINHGDHRDHGEKSIETENSVSSVPGPALGEAEGWRMIFDGARNL